MGTRAEKPLVVIDADKSHRPIFPADMGAYWGLLRQLSISAFRNKYRHLRTSFAWYYVRPSLMTAVFVLLKQHGGGDLGAGMPYALFVYSGISFWFIFSETVLAASSALTRDAGLIQKIYYPIIISPLAQTLARMGDVGLALIGLAVLQVALGVPTDWELFMVVPVTLQLLVLAMGIGCAFAALALTVRDVGEALSVALYLGLFLSPVFYAPEDMPGAARALLQINPMVGSLNAVRAALTADVSFPWTAWAYSCAVTLAALGLGLVLFARASRNVAENL